VIQHFSAVSAGDGVRLAVKPRPTARRGRKDAYNAKRMPAKTMGGFRLVAGVTDQHFDPLAFGCRNERVGELDMIGLCAAIDQG